jgi:hypothetical protein
VGASLLAMAISKDMKNPELPVPWVSRMNKYV